MATFKPGRLQRMINRVISPDATMFALITEAGTYYREDIQQVTIRRGKDGRGGGLHPSVMDITVNGYISATISGSNTRFIIREPVADMLAAHLDGAASGADLSWRFTGRVGQLEVNDDGRRLDTTISAASWTARMLRRNRVTYPVTGQKPGDVIMDAFGMNETNPPAGLTMSQHGDFDTIASDQDPVTPRESVDVYGEAIGVCLLETRDGDTRIMSLPYRKGIAEGRANVRLPLVRSQAIAPATWQQANDKPAVNIYYKITNSDGNVVERHANVSTWDPTEESVHLDWSRMKSASNGTAGQSYAEAYGRVYASSARAYTLPTIRVDLIRLIDSPAEYHRRVAAQLLRLEAGDPVFLSDDWPSTLRGTHFAEGITETITFNSWELELSLAPWSHITGTSAQPTIEPRIWESARRAWDDETRTWNEAA